MLEGRVARATRSTSKFGIEYDSIADMISFGLAPAMLLYAWVLEPAGRRAWLVAALFAVCAALRLARFNVQQNVDERNRYQGLPTTIAGGFTAVSVWFVHWAGVFPPFSSAVALVVALGFAALALLMVSSVPYLSLKGFRLGGRHGFTLLVAATLAGIVVLIWPEPVLFAAGVLYVTSGPALWLVGRRRSAPAGAARAAGEGESPGDV
jgi:CDP-diacylglycerol--serine O-phosphatidyltransferase